MNETEERVPQALEQTRSPELDAVLGKIFRKTTYDVLTRCEMVRRRG